MVGLFLAATVACTSATVMTLYQVTLSQHRANLSEMVQSQARLMVSVAGHLRAMDHNLVDHEQAGHVHENPPIEGMSDAVVREAISIMQDSHRLQPGFGQTGEFVFGHRVGETIQFVLPPRHLELTEVPPVPFAGTAAEPMRRALNGQTGTLIGPDYRGKPVLAAHTPLEGFDHALVAKKDLAEIRAPFIRAGIFAGLAILIVLLGTIMLFRRVGAPLVHQLEELVATRTNQLHEANAKLKDLARHDALTGLANRVVLLERIEQALKMARRDQTISALLFIDLDDFKPVNDKHGHAIGDQLLCAVGGRLSSELREIDTLVRYGGDEFVVVLNDIGGLGNAEKVAAKLIATLRTPFNLTEAVTVQIGASIGIAIIDQRVKTVDAVLSRADHAMYSVKRGAKNAFRVG